MPNNPKMEVSLIQCMKSAAVYLTACCLLNLTGIFCSPVGANNDCIRKLQMTCGTEYETLSDQTDSSACSHLSNTILCVACAVESCRVTFEETVRLYSMAPYNCQLSQKEIGLLQGLPEYKSMCPGSETTKPPEIFTLTNKPQNSQLGSNGETSGQARFSVMYFLVVLSTTSVLVLR